MRRVKKTKEQNYNVRVVDNGDGTYSLGFIHRLREYEGGGGEWIEGSRSKLERLLIKGEHKKCGGG